ncbi:MAG: LUD domain-containing protein, partial [Limisphaerales bacterium]
MQSNPDNHNLPPRAFIVTSAMVQRFAQLTGDFSSLHMNADFARRSMYRENVVHGFLPLLFLGALDWKTVAGSLVEIERLAASFLKPVYAGDKLVFTPTFIEVNEGVIETEFEISNSETGTLVTVSGPGTPPTVSLLPETHVAIVHAHRIVHGMEEAWKLMRVELSSLPRAVNLISGPSRT